MSLRSRSFKGLVLVSALALVAAVPALAKRGEGDHPHSREAVGTITAFDPTTMMLELELTYEGAAFMAPVHPDAKVKVAQRHNNGNGLGRVGHGDLSDLVPGATVLEMRERRGVVTRLLVGSTSDEEADQGGDDSGEIDEGTDEGSGDDDVCVENCDESVTD